MSEAMRFRPDDITVGDMEDFEEISGKPFMEALGAIEGGNGTASLDAKMLKALVFIIKRAEDPAFTLDDARKVKIGELVLDYEPVNPTEAASSNSAPPSATSGD